MEHNRPDYRLEGRSLGDSCGRLEVLPGERGGVVRVAAGDLKLDDDAAPVATEVTDSHLLATKHMAQDSAVHIRRR